MPIPIARMPITEIHAGQQCFSLALWLNGPWLPCTSQHLGLCTLWKMIDLFIIGVNAGFASFESL